MRIPLLAGLTLLVCGRASANEKLTHGTGLVHQPGSCAYYGGGTDWRLSGCRAGCQHHPPSDPALPPRTVAARRADLAITYQPQVHFFADEGLPLIRVGTLIHSPLNTVIALDQRIKSPADLQGKKSGILGERY